MQDLTTPPPEEFTVLDEVDMEQTINILSNVPVVYLFDGEWISAGNHPRSGDFTVKSYAGGHPVAIPAHIYRRLFPDKPQLKPTATRWPQWDRLCYQTK